MTRARPLSAVTRDGRVRGFTARAARGRDIRAR